MLGVVGLRLWAAGRRLSADGYLYGFSVHRHDVESRADGKLLHVAGGGAAVDDASAGAHDHYRSACRCAEHYDVGGTGGNGYAAAVCHAVNAGGCGGNKVCHRRLKGGCGGGEAQQRGGAVGKGGFGAADGDL